MHYFLPIVLISDFESAGSENDYQDRAGGVSGIEDKFVNTYSGTHKQVKVDWRDPTLPTTTADMLTHCEHLLIARKRIEHSITVLPQIRDALDDFVKRADCRYKDISEYLKRQLMSLETSNKCLMNQCCSTQKEIDILFSRVRKAGDSVSPTARFSG